MKKVLQSAVAVVAFSAATVSASDLYVFVGAGYSSVDTATTVSAAVDESDTTKSFGLGYKYNDHLAVELGYVDLGELKYDALGTVTGQFADGQTVTFSDKLGLDIKGFTIGARGDAQLSDSFDIFGRVGAYIWESDLSFNTNATVNGTPYSAGTVSGFEDGVGIYLGAGAEYNFTESFSLNAQLTNYAIDYAGTDTNVTTLTAGAMYKF